MGVALDEPKENEQTVEADGFDVLIADEVKPFATGNMLDWVKSIGGEGFVLRPESGGCC